MLPELLRQHGNRNAFSGGAGRGRLRLRRGFGFQHLSATRDELCIGWAGPYSSAKRSNLCRPGHLTAAARRDRTTAPLILAILFLLRRPMSIPAASFICRSRNAVASVPRDGSSNSQALRAGCYREHGRWLSRPRGLHIWSTLQAGKKGRAGGKTSFAGLLTVDNTAHFPKRSVHRATILHPLRRSAAWSLLRANLPSLPMQLMLSYELRIMVWSSSGPCQPINVHVTELAAREPGGYSGYAHTAVPAGDFRATSQSLG